MKKFVLTALATAALAVAGAASAQDLTDMLNHAITGQQYVPPVVNGTPIYVDQYGRQVYRDAAGREVLVQSQPGGYGIVGRDAWGRPVYGQVAAANPRWDRDGDSIPNRRDRYPDDPRYR